jgi:hypothetical protein
MLNRQKREGLEKYVPTAKYLQYQFLGIQEEQQWIEHRSSMRSSQGMASGGGEDEIEKQND